MILRINNTTKLMETFETIKKFLEEGGKCLIIENGKPIGVVLTMEEYEKIKENKKSELLMSDVNTNNTKENPIPTLRSEIGGRDPDQSVGIGSPAKISEEISVGEAMIKEMNFPEASADPADINLVDAGDVTLEDLGLDELPY